MKKFRFNNRTVIGKNTELCAESKKEIGELATIVIGNSIMIMAFMNRLADVVFELKLIFVHIAVDMLLLEGSEWI